MTSLRPRMLLAALLAMVPFAASADPCPESCLNDDCSTAVARDTVVMIVCEPFAPVQGGQGSYDLVTGQLHATTSGCSGWYGPNGGYISVSASDRFRLVGPSGGGLVAFEARLLLTGGVGGFVGTCGGTILEVGGGSATANDGGNMYLYITLGVPLSHRVGDEFQIDYYASASAGGSGGLGFVDGQLSFFGLPPGYGVTSCQGYAGDGAVSTLPASWGALKLRYR